MPTASETHDGNLVPREAEVLFYHFCKIPYFSLKSLNFFLAVCFCGTGDQNQGLERARRVLYYRATSPA